MMSHGLQFGYFSADQADKISRCEEKRWVCHLERTKKKKKKEANQQHGLLNLCMSVFVLTLFVFAWTVWKCASSTSSSHILLPLRPRLSTSADWLRRLITEEPSWSSPSWCVVVVPSERWQIMVSSSCAFTEEERGWAGWRTGFFSPIDHPKPVPPIHGTH